MLSSRIFTITTAIGTFFCLLQIHESWQPLLKKVLFFKQLFTEHIKMTVKDRNIKNQTYHFFNDMINIKNFDSNSLKIAN